MRVGNPYFLMKANTWILLTEEQRYTTDLDCSEQNMLFFIQYSYLIIMFLLQALFDFTQDETILKTIHWFSQDKFPDNYELCYLEFVYYVIVS